MNAKFKKFIEEIKKENERNFLEKPECEYLLSNEHKELMKRYHAEQTA